MEDGNQSSREDTVARYDETNGGATKAMHPLLSAPAPAPAIVPAAARPPPCACSCVQARRPQAPPSPPAAPPPPLSHTFHRRDLPEACVAFSSVAGKRLFREALAAEAPHNFMQIYFPLAEQFTTQAEPAFCGLATLAMCLNALQIDPGRIWKGPWRWFSEDLLDCCTPLHVAKRRGVSLSEFVCLARCNGVEPERFNATEALTLDAFRAIVQRSCASVDEIVVLNYSRQTLGQTGDGHFSPIGAYHAGEDMVLLLDVARFKYPPHWVKLDLVLASMQRLNAVGQSRGLVVLRASAKLPHTPIPVDRMPAWVTQCCLRTDSPVDPPAPEKSNHPDEGAPSQ